VRATMHKFLHLFMITKYMVDRSKFGKREKKVKNLEL
jgi:hypothetical protein